MISIEGIRSYIYLALSYFSLNWKAKTKMYRPDIGNLKKPISSWLLLLATWRGLVDWFGDVNIWCLKFICGIKSGSKGSMCLPYDFFGLLKWHFPTHFLPSLHNIFVIVFGCNSKEIEREEEESENIPNLNAYGMQTVI